LRRPAARRCFAWVAMNNRPRYIEMPRALVRGFHSTKTRLARRPKPSRGFFLLRTDGPSRWVPDSLEQANTLSLEVPRTCACAATCESETGPADFRVVTAGPFFAAVTPAAFGSPGLLRPSRDPRRPRLGSVPIDPSRAPVRWVALVPWSRLIQRGTGRLMEWQTLPSEPGMQRRSLSRRHEFCLTRTRS
jgi:hypothetical protein